MKNLLPLAAATTTSFNSFLFGGVINDQPRGNNIANSLDIRTYDLSNVPSINNTGLAHMIDLMKSSLINGIEIQFVNTSEKVKSKIRAMGMVHLFNCG